MPLSALGMDASITWTMYYALTGFANRTQGPDGQEFSFDLGGIDTSVWNQIYATQVTLNPGTNSGDLDIRAFTNLAGGSVTATKALGLIGVTSGGDVTITPGASNGFNWFFNGSSTATTSGLRMLQGVFINCGDSSDTAGSTIDATHKTLRLLNGSGSATATVTLGVIVGGNSA